MNLLNIVANSGVKGSNFIFSHSFALEACDDDDESNGDSSRWEHKVTHQTIPSPLKTRDF